MAFTLRFCKERHDSPGETAYALSDLALDGTTLTKSATVKIIPTFQEK